jgi:simple sugar transport system permease protein
VIGSAIGALTLGVISNGLVLLRVDVYWVPIVQGTILIVAIFLNSKLFSRLVGSRR